MQVVKLDASAWIAAQDFMMHCLPGLARRTGMAETSTHWWIL